MVTELLNLRNGGSLFLKSQSVTMISARDASASENCPWFYKNEPIWRISRTALLLLLTFSCFFWHCIAHIAHLHQFWIVRTRPKSCFGGVNERWVGVGGTFWLFIFTLNRAKKWFNSIFNSKLNRRYSFNELFIQYSVRNIDSMNYSFNIQSEISIQNFIQKIE